MVEEEEAKRWEAKRFDPRVRDFAYEKRKAVPPSICPLSPLARPLPLVPVVYYNVLKPPRDTLSSRMRNSLPCCSFWLTSAIIYSGTFDRIYWQRLDERYNGKRESAESRVDAWAANDMRAAELEMWVDQKMRDLLEYRTELAKLEEEEKEQKEEAEIFWETVEDMD